MSTNAPDRSTIVLKFGSSILTHEQEVWAVVSEIKRELARGRTVVAVVSAMWGVTDRLIEGAKKVVESLDGPALARLLATGEHITASLVSLALAQEGIGHTLLDARALRLRAEGPTADSDPVSVDSDAIERALGRGPVVVLPGFEAVDENGDPTLLGRGGSDLTAVFIADALHADVRLIKDVDGVYERDPARIGPAPRRFSAIAYDRVGSVAGRLVQQKAVDFAAVRNLPIRVAALNSDAGTLITNRTELEPAAGASGIVEPVEVLLNRAASVARN